MILQRRKSAWKKCTTANLALLITVDRSPDLSDQSSGPDIYFSTTHAVIWMTCFSSFTWRYLPWSSSSICCCLMNLQTGQVVNKNMVLYNKLKTFDFRLGDDSTRIMIWRKVNEQTLVVVLAFSFPSFLLVQNHLPMQIVDPPLVQINRVRHPLHDSSWWCILPKTVCKTWCQSGNFLLYMVEVSRTLRSKQQNTLEPRSVHTWHRVAAPLHVRVPVPRHYGAAPGRLWQYYCTVVCTVPHCSIQYDTISYVIFFWPSLLVWLSARDFTITISTDLTDHQSWNPFEQKQTNKRPT